MNPETKDRILAQTADFAGGRIASRRNLGRTDHFPSDLWMEMGSEGLLGIGIPEAYGGSGGDPLTILLAGETLVRNGRNPGIALSWLIHQMVGLFFLARFGRDDQKEAYLPGMTQGKDTGSLAISEPSAGARPKDMTTRAGKEGDGFILNGEKTCLTNGPLARFFIVFAVTGEENGRRTFTAFLVPKNAEGTYGTGSFFFPFLKPCPHGGIRLENCRLGRDAVFGEEDRAWETLSIPFRTWEDVFLTGLVSGGIGRLFELLLSTLRKKPGSPPGPEVKTFLGSAWSSLEGIRVVSREAAKKLETLPAHGEITSMMLFARQNIRRLLRDLDEFVAVNRLSPGEEWALLMKDLIPTTRIAGAVHEKKKEKIGTALLTEERRHDRFGSTL